MTSLQTNKPAGSNWTDDQWRAITAEGSDVLVAAAAGSGKTAVLVERIIRKICARTDVDRLLVATFTKAAAAEMKERIGLALEKELERQPDSEHLRRQLALLNRASITTLHSFCLDVIRRYYSLIGLDPGFRIANETESELLRIDVLDELFEERYEGAGDDGAFLRLADRFGGEKGDEPLYRLVQQLYDFAQSHPWPEYWLKETAAGFEVQNIAELGKSEWVRSIREDALLSLDGAISLLEQALRLTREPAGPAPYAETFAEDIRLVRELRDAVTGSDWEHWFAPFQAAQFGKLKAMRGDDYDKALQERAKELREGAKKLVGTLAAELFGRTPEEFVAELQELAPLMKALAALVSDFSARYEAAKREKGLLDFGDLEHYCLRILRAPESTPERTVPSAAALEYRRQFDEILLDEYQDTNMVQEAIVSLIARPAPGNRFMVGDVKQSIYRFRLAEPKLFLNKYKRYKTDAELRALGVNAPFPGGSASPPPEAGAEAALTEVQAVKSGALSDRAEGDRPLSQESAGASGLRIDLARNFRSRAEVVDAVNGVFRPIMRESVAEMDYDERAELVCGASYPAPDNAEAFAVEMAVIGKTDGGASGGDETPDNAGGEDGQEDAPEGGNEAPSAEELQTVQLEARWIAERLRAMMDGGFRVYDNRRGASRPMQWRDAVILLRATRAWAPVIIEELQACGIPAYAELGSGYFDATEVETVLSLLRVIDNPYQDIPLAGVLRSPLFGLNTEELALIRIRSKHAGYYDAVLHAAGDLLQPEELRNKLSAFLDRLDRWREEARQGSLTELLRQIYRDTGYYEFAGGLPGGAQRQANLRALLDRAKAYEATSFRGLFRFLRFIERMRDTGGDLGTARALGEQEDVVRIMSIHKSKGLEFPVVFIAGLGKQFNQQDARSAFLKHKELGFGPRYVDPERRIGYPSLPYLAIRRRMRMETLAEEMRILYVALTRPKEKMILVGSVNDAAKKLQEWQAAANGGSLPDFRLASATSFLDWLGPLAAGSLVPGEGPEHSETGGPDGPAAAWLRLRGGIVPSGLLVSEAAAGEESDSAADEALAERLQGVVSLAVLDSVEPDEEIRSRLEWAYPHRHAPYLAAKSSVTEMKRLHAAAVTEGEASALMLPEELAERERPEQAEERERTAPSPSMGGSYTFRLRRPRFMEENALTAAEKGTVSHLIMQHIPLSGEIGEERLRQTAEEMIERKLLTRKQAESVDLSAIAGFFESDLGRRLLGARRVRREVPFSCMFPASRVYPWTGSGEEAGEPILIQGVVDCLFEDEAGLVLLDYKTDRIYMKQWEQAAERHRFQLELYAEALEKVLGKPVDECHVFFFDGGRSVRLR